MLMSENFQKLITTPAVTRAQIQYFGRTRIPTSRPFDDNGSHETEPHDLLTPEEIEFISRRDSF